VWPERQGALRGAGGDKLPRTLEVVQRHEDLARAAVAYSVAGACTQVRVAVIAGNSSVLKRPQIVSASSEFPTTMSRTLFIRPRYLAERERVRLGAGLEERDLERPLANPVVLSHELVEAALPEHAVAVLVHVHAV
jgi:hypothetical protein